MPDQSQNRDTRDSQQSLTLLSPEVGQVWDTGEGSLARVIEVDEGIGGAAHFMWLDRKLDQWWTKQLVPLHWTLYDCPHPPDSRRPGSDQTYEWCEICNTALDR